MSQINDQLLQLCDELSTACNQLKFSQPVTHTYNPLDYARNGVKAYLEQFAQTKKKHLFIGMNPGPFGMAQTGVPFGEIAAVRDWMKLTPSIGKPTHEHEKRPVEGLACTRAEVSGSRLWGLFADQFGSAQNFFTDHLVWNYCPLLFSEIHKDGKRQVCRNITPDKLHAKEAAKLNKLCDEYLIRFVEIVQPQNLIGVGAYAEKCLKRLFTDRQTYQIYRMIHPSPASPAANKDFAGTAVRQLKSFGVWS